MTNGVETDNVEPDTDLFFYNESTPLQFGQEDVIERSVKETKGWDVFRDPRPKTDSGSMKNHNCSKITFKIIKVFAYIVLFFIILVSSVISKGTILLMTSQLRINSTITYCNKLLDTERTFVAVLSDEKRIAWIWCIIFAFWIPEIGTLIRCLRICFFKSWMKPTVDHFIFLATMETLHVIGLAIMFLRVLPELDVIQGAMLTNCVCFVPGLLGLLSRNKKPDDSIRFVLLAVDLAALSAQATSFVVWPLLDTSNTSLWLIPVALIMVSCGWWENYVPVQSDFFLTRSLSRVKEGLKTTRYFTYAFVSVWKIIVFVISSVVILHLNGEAVSHLFTKFSGAFSDHNITVYEVQSTVGGGTIPDLSDVLPDGVTAIIITDSATPLYVLLIQVLGAYFAYVFGKFACKIMVQPFSYALPVNLTVPVSLSLLIAACALRIRNPCTFHNIIPDYLFYTSPDLTVLSDLIVEEYAWVWLLWILSQTWITLHIWIPKCERLASTNKLFVTPIYSGLLIDQSLALNRNSNDQPKFILMDSKKIVDADRSDDDEETIYKTPTSSVRRSTSTIEKSDLVTRIYACGTMWRETKDEMLDFLKSILRMDQDQCARKNVQNFLKITDPDYYELETHIFFDEAFETDNNNEVVIDIRLNRFVKCFINSVNEAIYEIHGTNLRIKSPKKCITPYGGRLIWTLPGKTKMILHLKDTSKIRQRKRWSQVMYMYYLLGHRIMDQPITISRKEVIAENTYLLILDGDIDFQPSSVKLLIDLMKKDKNLGAACGRIHPVGSGPIVWYQMFEYAITHWLQKSTEHIIGCVICSPGCFSLIRSKALMDDNVIRKYTTNSKEPKHYLQYDRGEDRWLCTLLLQRGYRMEYSAASDAYTHVPENFQEFYRQRRRWIPSTIANIIDLLRNYKSTIKNNQCITLSYVLYQILLMAGTILGPGAIFLILVGAFVSAFQIPLSTSFYCNMIPVLLFLIVCFTCKSNIQLNVAAIISILYGFAMMVVVLSIIIQMLEYSWLSPSSLFFILVSGLLVISGLMHPQELICLPCGLIYYLTIPSIYMLLVIFSITNLNDVEWGTRELDINDIRKKKTLKTNSEEYDNDAIDKESKEKLLLRSILRNNKDRDNKPPLNLSFTLFNFSLNKNDNEKLREEQNMDEIITSLGKVMKILDTIDRCSDRQLPANLEIRGASIRAMNSTEVIDRIINQEAGEEDSELENTTSISTETNRNMTCLRLRTPYWFIDDNLENLEIDYISVREDQFWKDLIEEYLLPKDDDETEKARIAIEFKNFRDVSTSAFLLLNSLFVICIFLMELNQDVLYIQWPFGTNTTISYDSYSQEVHITNSYLKLEPIGLVFFIFFIPILTIQFTAMLLHRFGTFCHILASTELNFFKKRADISCELLLNSEDAVDIVKDIQRIDENNENDDTIRTKPSKRETIRNLEINRRKSSLVYSDLDDKFRARFFSTSEGCGLPRNSSVRRSSKAFRAFEARRNTIIEDERRKSKIDILEEDNNHQYDGIIDDNNQTDPQSSYNAKRGEKYTFINRAFDGSSSKNVDDLTNVRMLNKKKENPLIKEEESSSQFPMTLNRRISIINFNDDNRNDHPTFQPTDEELQETSTDLPEVDV